MKGTDWGRIVARLTAVLIFTRALDFTYLVAERYASDPGYIMISRHREFDITRIVIAATLMTLAIALWVFADKFAPKSHEEIEDTVEPDKLVIALVAAIGAFLFLRYLNYAFSFGFNRVFSEYFRVHELLSAQVVYGVVMALLGALMVVYARKTAGWLTK